MRYSIRSLLIFTLLLAFILALLRLWHDAWNSMFQGKPPGFVTERADWPYGLDYFVEEAELTEPQIEAMEVYRVGQGPWDDEFLWKFELSPNIEESLVNECQLVPVKPGSKAVTEFLKKIPDQWSKPDLEDACACFSTPEFLETYLEGYIYTVIIDRDSETIFVWFIFIF